VYIIQMVSPTLREILIAEEYKTNKTAIEKQKIWSSKQNDILYNTGRPIFFKNIVNPPHLWFLYENKYKKFEF